LYAATAAVATPPQHTSVLCAMNSFAACALNSYTAVARGDYTSFGLCTTSTAEGRITTLSLGRVCGPRSIIMFNPKYENIAAMGLNIETFD
ncbi:hypothetical protein THAOC_29220, partial [Thalassiosira oceanica]